MQLFSLPAGSKSLEPVHLLLLIAILMVEFCRMLIFGKPQIQRQFWLLWDSPSESNRNVISISTFNNCSADSLTGRLERDIGETID